MTEEVEENVRDVMTELLNEDRLQYIKMIGESENGATSQELAEEISRKRGITEKRKIKNENVAVNRRLRTLVERGVLVSEEGRYTLSSRGSLLMDSWQELIERMETMSKFDDFFDTHSTDGIPKTFFRQIYRLRNAQLTDIANEWIMLLMEQMKKMERKLYNVTQYLNITEEIIKKKKKGEIDIVIIYQFKNYPHLNFSNEKPLFDKLNEADVEFRYIKLENRYPIGIRVIDDKWANFLLPRTSDRDLDRNRVFYGTDPDFVQWCRDLMYHVWHFEAEPLDTKEVKAKEKE